MKHHLSIDLETFSSVPIGKAGAYKYVQSPDFEILLFAYSLNDSPVVVVDLAQGEVLPDWLYKAIESPEYIKHAYNAAFEWYCLSKFYGHLLPVDQWRDTMLHGLYCGYTAGLDATGKALGLPAEKQKLSVGKALIRYFCVPCTPTQSNGGRHRNLPKHDPDKWDLFKTYCLGDVTTEKEIERRLSAFPVPDDIEKQWQTDLLINARGVAVDMGMVRGALEIGAQSRDRLMQEAISITGLENPNSIAQLSTWLEKATDTPVTDLRKDTVAAMLESNAVTGSANRMLEIRQELGKTSTKKYDAIEAAVCGDGRVRGLLQFYGANRTGRWAGRLVQVQNLPRTYIGQLPLAREAVRNKQEDKLRFLYGSVPDNLLMKNYRKLKAHYSHVSPETLEVSAICSMRRKTGLMMSHVDKMLAAYEAMCKESLNPDEGRRWEALYLRYIDSKRMSVDDIASQLNIDKRTFYRDINKAMEDMAVLLFGIEAIGSWKHKRAKVTP